MARSKKQPLTPGEKCTVEIIDLNHRGEGVGKKEGFTLFVPRALPGESALVMIKNVRKNYAEAELINVTGASENRVEPPCPHFPTCGGCQLLHLAYEAEPAWKRKRVKETLRRIAGITPEIKPVVGMKNPRHYRNKADLHLEITGSTVKAGFYEAYSHRVVNINSCLVQHPSNNILLKAVREAARDYMSYFNNKPGNEELPFCRATLRSSFATGESLLVLTGPGINQSKKLPDQNNRLHKLADMISTHAGTLLKGIVFMSEERENSGQTVLAGRDYLEEIVGPFTFRVSPRSFFQVNTAQAETLYDEALSLSGSPRTAFDLYCGTGNFALFLAQKAERVIGIDSDSSAIEDAKENARLNKTGNTNFVTGRAEKSPELLRQGSRPKTIFLNPPRTGCSPDLLEAISQAAPERVVYISCNPATLARDLKILARQGYRAGEVRLVDMFPHTSHVESVVSLSRPSNEEGCAAGAHTWS